MNINSFFLNSSLITTCDSAQRWQTGIQDPATPMLEGMLSFYNELMFYLVFIGIAVICMLYVILTSFREENSKKNIKSFNIFVELWSYLNHRDLRGTEQRPGLYLQIREVSPFWQAQYSGFGNLKTKTVNKYDPREEFFPADLYKPEKRLLVVPVGTYIRIKFEAETYRQTFTIKAFDLQLIGDAKKKKWPVEPDNRPFIIKKWSAIKSFLYSFFEKVLSFFWSYLCKVWVFLQILLGVFPRVKKKQLFLHTGKESTILLCKPGVFFIEKSNIGVGIPFVRVVCLPQDLFLIWLSKQTNK